LSEIERERGLVALAWDRGRAESSYPYAYLNAPDGQLVALTQGETSDGDPERCNKIWRDPETGRRRERQRLPRRRSIGKRGRQAEER